MYVEGIQGFEVCAIKFNRTRCSWQNCSNCFTESKEGDVTSLTYYNSLLKKCQNDLCVSQSEYFMDCSGCVLLWVFFSTLFSKSFCDRSI